MTPSDRTPSVSPRDHVAAARSLGLFFGVGGAWLLGTSLTVPGFGGYGVILAASLVLGALFVAAGAYLWLRAPCISSRVLAMGAPLSILTIGVLCLATRDSSTGSQLFLLWPVLYTASFLNRRHNIFVLLEVLVVEAVVLGALEPPTLAIVDTLGLFLAYSIATIAVMRFRNRVDGLMEVLSAQAREDSLTGLPNRRAFDENLARLAAISGRSGEPLSLLAIDVDRFKEINDTRGHVVGDQVLAAVAEALRRAGREGDLVARVGGDEFAVLLPACPLGDAAAMGAAVREQVRAHTSRMGEAVTVSVGAATLPDTASSPEQLMVAADAALYAIKRDGREPTDRLESARR